MTVNNKLKKTGIGAGLIGMIIGGIFAFEGGFSDHPSDPGGKTMYGITETTARNFGYTGEMEDLSKEQASDIYKKIYIIDPGYMPLVEIQPAVAHKVIDAGVNCGVHRSSRWFQNGLNALSRDGRDYPIVLVDGNVGPETISAYISLEKKRGQVKACELMIKMIDIQQGQHYLSLNNLREFTVGWIDHRIQNIPLNMCTNYEEEYVRIFENTDN